MAPLFKRTQVWVVEFTYDGRPRRWFKALPQGSDAARVMATQLHELYGEHARLREVRPASEQEELDYVRGNLPRNVLCPTGRAPRSRPEEPPH
jgi:hypothetical protein